MYITIIVTCTYKYKYWPLNFNNYTLNHCPLTTPTHRYTRRYLHTIHFHFKSVSETTPMRPKMGRVEGVASISSTTNWLSGIKTTHRRRINQISSGERRGSIESKHLMVFGRHSCRQEELMRGTKGSVTIRGGRGGERVVQTIKK